MKCEVGLSPALKELTVLEVYFCFNYTCQLSEPTQSSSTCIIAGIYRKQQPSSDLLNPNSLD